jgi:MFS family permease
VRDLTMFSSLRHEQYRRLWLAAMLASVANWTMLTGRGWVAFHLHHHSSTVGLVVFAAMLPYLFVTPFAGVLADRFDRRKLLVAALGANLAASLALALFVLAGGRDEWVLVLLSFLGGATRSLEIPARQSMVPALVPERDLLNAVALGGLADHGSRLLGPLAAPP